MLQQVPWELCLNSESCVGINSNTTKMIDGKPWSTGCYEPTRTNDSEIDDPVFERTSKNLDSDLLVLDPRNNIVTSFAAHCVYMCV